MAGEDELDLEGALGAAIDEQSGVEAPAQRQQPEQQEDPFPQSQREYNRDETGKFARKEAEEAAAAQAQADQGAQPLKAWSPLWLKQEHGIEWDKLPEPFRKALEQREREAMQGIEKHATTAKSWEPINKAIEPYVQELAASGQTPQQYVGNLIEADKYLRADPIQAINWLVQSYVGQGWDIRALADYMDQQGVETKKADPVQQELIALKNEISQLKAAPVQQARAQTEREIQAWSKDKPYFEDVRNDMAALASKNPQATLDELYDRATWAHPQIRERILSDQRKADVKRARDNSLGTRDAGALNGTAHHKPTMTVEQELSSLIDGFTV